MKRAGERRERFHGHTKCIGLVSKSVKLCNTRIEGFHPFHLAPFDLPHDWHEEEGEKREKRGENGGIKKKLKITIKLCNETMH